VIVAGERQPSWSDQNYHHGGMHDCLLYGPCEDFAGPDAEYIHEYFFFAEPLRQRLVKSTGIRLGIIAPIAQKDARIFLAPH
jgi:hypothetical protein